MIRLDLGGQLFFYFYLVNPAHLADVVVICRLDLSKINQSTDPQ